MSGSPRPWLAPLAPLYRLAIAARELSLHAGFASVDRLRWPVVSIGSLSAGGAGKTPLTLALAHALAQRGVQVDVLSRGYGRRRQEPARVDPAGTAEDFGDEPILIAQTTGLPVYVAAQRYQAGLLAERQAESDAADSAPQPRRIHLLDDGFQHRRLHRDADIVLLSRFDREDRLLPAGNLREPLSALRRAAILAVPAEDAELAPQLGWEGPVWRLRRRMEVPLVESPAAAFCGIARPEQFFPGITAAGISLAARIAFPDHHCYTPADLARLRTAAQSAGAKAFLTTEKDCVRLGKMAAQLAQELPLDAVRLHIEIDEQEAAVAGLMDALLSRQA